MSTSYLQQTELDGYVSVLKHGFTSLKLQISSHSDCFCFETSFSIVILQVVSSRIIYCKLIYIVTIFFNKYALLSQDYKL